MSTWSRKDKYETFGIYQLPSTEEVSEKSFNTTNEVVDNSSDLNKIYQLFVDKFMVQTTEFQEKGRALQRIMHLEVNINKYSHSPISGSSYIKLPKFIESKGACINVENQDNYCFAWAITSALFPVNTMVTNMMSYPDFPRVFKCCTDAGISFPVKLRDIKKFEDMCVIYQLMFMV